MPPHPWSIRGRFLLIETNSYHTINKKVENKIRKQKVESKKVLNLIKFCHAKVNPGSCNPITAGNSITDRNLIVFFLSRLKDGRPRLYHMIEVRGNLNDVSVAGTGINKVAAAR